MKGILCVSNSGKLALQLRAAPAPCAARPITKLGAALRGVGFPVNCGLGRGGEGLESGLGPPLRQARGQQRPARGAPGLAESGKDRKDASRTGTERQGCALRVVPWRLMARAPPVHLPTEGPPRLGGGARAREEAEPGRGGGGGGACTYVTR